MLGSGNLSQQAGWEPFWELAKILISGLLSRTLAPPRPVAHNLPGEVPRPIGRDRELRWLRKQLSLSSRSTVCVLVGPGGVGKTHLALAIAHEYRRRAESRVKRLEDGFRRLFRCPSLGFFDAIVYIPVQAVIMTPLGIHPRQHLKQLPEITAQIARVLGDSDLLRQSPLEREESVLAVLSRRRILLILDGLEEVDPKILDFIRRVPSPSRILITSRRSVNTWPSLDLESLDPQSTRRLILREAEERGIKMEPEEIESLARVTHGLPLAIVIGVAQLARGISMDVLLEQLREGRGELAEYLVEGSVKTLRQEDEAAYRLFRALALFDPEVGALREALGATADLPKNRRDRGLMNLVRASLIEHERKADRFRFRHPLIHARAVRALEEDPQEASHFRQRWITWYQARLAERPQNIPLLRAEQPNLLQILEALRQEDRMEELAQCLWEAQILLDEGPVEPYLDLLRLLFGWVLEHQQGGLLQGLTWDILTRGGRAWKNEFAERWWEQLRPHLSAGQQAVIEAEMRLWASPKPENVRSLQEAFRALQPECSEVDAEQAISVCNDLGFLLMDDRLWRPDYRSAREWLERGLALLQQHRTRLRDPQEWEAILRGNLALLVARAEGRYAEAMRILEEIRPHLRWKRDLAEWHLVMAVYSYRLCRIR
ncbi:AAA family ATPase, partial [Thermoflexus hugenholtzii]